MDKIGQNPAEKLLIPTKKFATDRQTDRQTVARRGKPLDNQSICSQTYAIKSFGLESDTVRIIATVKLQGHA